MANWEVENNQSKPCETTAHKDVSGRKVAFDYLRAFGVLLVLLHHAVHAYIISAGINLENPIATASPVVDAGRWPIFDLIVIYNETFFMPLLFFVSGLFVWQGLSRKGAREYLRSRLSRLGLPFLFGVVFLMPLAYYPAQLQADRITGVETSYWEFWVDLVRSGFGTAGPLWFLWVLLGFNCLAALLHRAIPDLGDDLRRRLGFILNRQGAFFGALIGLSIAAYLPAAILIGPEQWVGFGPFQVQASRIFLYLVYFLAGLVIGAYGVDRSVFRSDGPIARNWLAWLALGLAALVGFVFLVVVLTPLKRTILSETAFALCCGSTVLGMTGFFLRYAKRRVKILDSLSANSYGIYLVHYVFITWLQYLLLDTPLPPGVKGVVVFGITLALSWGAAAVMHRIPMIRKII